MRLLRTLVAILAAFAASTVVAQSFPNKPLRMIVPFPPGGGGDLMGRMLSEGLRLRIGQSVVVENRPGGDTVIGITATVQSAPDGYTILLTGDNFVIQQVYGRKLPYDGFKDIVPVTRVASVALVLTGTSQLGAKNVRDLIAMAKARPGEIKVGHLGASTHHYLSFKLIEQITGVRFLTVAYKGTGPATTALLSNEVDLIFTNSGSAVQMAAADKAVILGVTSASRQAVAPQIPTLAEAGVPGFDLSAIFYLYLPVGTPSPILSQLNHEMVAVLHDRTIADKINAAGFAVSSSTPEEAQAELQRTNEKMRKLIQGGGLKLEE